MISLQRLATVFLACCMASLPAFASADPTQDKATQIWQLLDYMAVDYAGAVTNGAIADDGEYAEMREFSQAAQRLIGELPDKPEKNRLQQKAVKRPPPKSPTSRAAWPHRF